MKYVCERSLALLSLVAGPAGATCDGSADDDPVAAPACVRTTTAGRATSVASRACCSRSFAISLRKVSASPRCEWYSLRTRRPSAREINQTRFVFMIAPCVRRSRRGTSVVDGFNPGSWREVAAGEQGTKPRNAQRRKAQDLRDSKGAGRLKAGEAGNHAVVEVCLTKASDIVGDVRREHHDRERMGLSSTGSAIQNCLVVLQLLVTAPLLLVKHE